MAPIRLRQAASASPRSLGAIPGRLSHTSHCPGGSALENLCAPQIIKSGAFDKSGDGSNGLSSPVTRSAITRLPTSGGGDDKFPCCPEKLAIYPCPYGGSVTTASTSASVGITLRQSPRYSVALPMRSTFIAGECFRRLERLSSALPQLHQQRIATAHDVAPLLAVQSVLEPQTRWMWFIANPINREVHILGNELRSFRQSPEAREGLLPSQIGVENARLHGLALRDQ